MAQVARNLTDVVDGFLSGHRLLILDQACVTASPLVHRLHQHPAEPRAVGA